MSPSFRLVLTLCIIFISLACGYYFKSLLDRKILQFDNAQVDKWRLRMQSLAVFVLLPFAAMFSLWGLGNPDPQLLILPILGICTYTVGGGLAILFARLLRLSRSGTGAYYCCGAFNNMGAIGGLVCLLFLGESTIALVALFRILEEIYYFSLSFPIARLFADTSHKKLPLNKNGTFIYVLLLIIVALGSGILLNLCHIRRPGICGVFASCGMLLATVIFLFAIGMTLRLSSIREYFTPVLYLCIIKFLLVPTVIFLLAWLCGVGTFDNGLALKVVLILSTMPVAMTALVPPALFDLDLDLANSCWIVTTIALLVILPILFYILPII